MILWRQRAIVIVPGGEPCRWRGYDVPQHLAPETSDALRFCAVEGDLELLDRRHWSTIEARGAADEHGARGWAVGAGCRGSPAAGGRGAGWRRRGRPAGRGWPTGWGCVGWGWLCRLVEAEQEAVRGLVSPVVGLAGEVAQDGGDLLGVRWAQPERAEHQKRLGLRSGDLGGERAERRLRGGSIVVSQPGRGAPVVLLGSAAYGAGSRGQDQARAHEHLQVVGDVALVAAQGHGELADRRLALGEGEQQPVAHRMSQRLELLRRGHGGDFVVLHDESVYIS